MQQSATQIGSGKLILNDSWLCPMFIAIGAVDGSDLRSRGVVLRDFPNVRGSWKLPKFGLAFLIRTK
jgi:hypothetical protein